MEFVRQCVIQTLNVMLIRYAKTVCASAVVTAIPRVPTTKRVSTNSVKVGILDHIESQLKLLFYKQYY